MPTPAGAQARGLRPRRRLFELLETVLLRVPGETAPGLPACAVVLVRLLVLPLLAVAGAFIPLLLLLPGLFAGPGGREVEDGIGRVILFSALAAAEESGRYAFVRRARDPDAALLLCGALLALVFSALLLACRADLFTLAWVLGAEGAACLALREGLRYPKDRAVLVLGLVVAHAGVYLDAPALGALLEGSAPALVRPL
jgi:hypothetical protein